MSIQQPTPENSPGNHNFEQVNYPETLEAIQQQQLKLKLEIERLRQDMERRRGWFQTLISGLVIAILIAISISSWFAYSLLAAEQIAQQEASKAAATQAEILERVEQLEEKLQNLSQRVPEEFSELKDATQSNQRELQKLSDRLNRVEGRVEAKQRESATPVQEE
ncbi:MAG: hypothetical protein WA919_03680 [Coleofasciculaceae cyanobacterium]